MKLLFYILASVSLTLGDTTSSDVCPTLKGAKWTFDHESTCCWNLGDKQLNFQQAQSYCQSIGGNLASITNLDEFEVASNYSLPLVFPPWTGTYFNGSWMNIDGTTGSDLPFYWQTGEPTQFGDCSVFRSGRNTFGMASAPCSDLQYPLCKYVPNFCPSTTVFLNATTGTFTSPNYPNLYYNNLNCRWLIIAPTNDYFISIKFEPYQVDVPDDYVAMFEGNSTKSLDRIDIYNSVKDQKNEFKSVGPSMTVLFHTDFDTTDYGFLATYKAILKYKDIVQNGTSGEVSSVNYPDNYNNDVEQYYYLNGPSNSKILATFDAFQTESAVDLLLIYDGPIVDQKFLIANLSGKVTTPMMFSSTKSSMSMLFVTDGSNTDLGWHMKWIANTN